MGGDSMKLAIATAMAEELAPFLQKYTTKKMIQRGKACIHSYISKDQVQLLLVETGIGKVNAAATTSLLCEAFSPDLIINTGTAGALSDKVAIGDVVIGRTLMFSDVDATGFAYAYGQVPQMPRQYTLSLEGCSLLQKLASPSKYQRHEGLMVTSDSFMSDPKAVQQVRKQFPTALCSDMESTALAQVAAFYEIPMINIRGISDIAGQHAAVVFEEHLHLAAYHAFEQTQAVLTKFCETSDERRLNERA